MMGRVRRPARRLVLVATTVASVACGESDDGASSATVPGVSPPATMGVVSSTSGPPIGSVAPVDVAEPCPASEAGGGPDAAGLAESSRLEPMIGQVLAYGNEHVEQFGAYGLVWHGSSDASVFVSFSGDLEAHRAALVDRVAFPDELVVCQVALSGSDARALMSSITAEFTGRFLSVGLGAGPIEVVLAPAEEALAAELVERYGDAVDVRVGALAYPLDTAEAVCEPPTGEVAADLAVSVVAPSGTIPFPDGAAAVSLGVRITNTGDVPVEFVSGIGTAVFLDLSGNVVSSNAGLSVADVGIEVALAPDESATVEAVASVASCDPALGYVLPPGEYRLVADVQRSADGVTRSVISDPLTVTLGG